MVALLIIIALLLGFIAIYLYKINENQKEFKGMREFYIKAIDQNARLTAYFLETPEYKKMQNDAINEEVESVFNKNVKKNK